MRDNADRRATGLYDEASWGFFPDPLNKGFSIETDHAVG